MGNILYSDNMTCFENMEACMKTCPRYECLYVDKCNGAPSAHYVCMPFDTRFFMWLIVAIFTIVALGCSALVACYAIRAIRASFRHALATENDIVFYNASNVHTFPHPANHGLQYYHNTPAGEAPPANKVDSNRDYNLRRNGYI